MKTLKISIAVFAIGMLLNVGCSAQNSIIGTISNYTIGEGILSSYDMVSMEKIEIGKIDPEGHFTIPLDANYLTVVKEQAEKAKDNAPKGWEIKFNTVASTFMCDFNNESIEYLDDGTEKVTYVGSNKKNEILYIGGESIVTGIPDLYFNDKNKVTRVLYAVSDPKIANWLFYFWQNPIVKGYYLRWFFVENEASAKGECVIPTYTGNDDENYMNATLVNLNLQKGWNIIKYDITEVFTDVNNKTYAAKTEISTLTELPKDLKWVSVIYE